MNLLPFRLSFLFIILLGAASCKKSGDGKVAANLDEEKELLSVYFDAATSGAISSAESFHYVLKTPLSSEPEDGELQKLIRFEPDVKGNVTLTNRSVITFTPAQPLASNALYQITLNLPLFGESRYNEKITYTVQTVEQQIKTDKKGFVLRDNGEVDVLLDIKSADVLDLKILESCFSSGHSRVSFLPNHKNQYQGVFTFRNINEANTIIEFDGKSLKAKSKESIPPFSFNTKEFTISHVFHDKGEKEMNLYFSKIINPKQDLTGLLTANGQTPNYSIDQNVIKIFLDPAAGTQVIEIFVSKGLMAKDGSVLASDHRLSYEHSVQTPNIDFVSSGNYFPSEGDFKIPVKARGLKEAKITVIEIKQENVMHYLAWHSLEYSDYYSLRMYGKPVFDKVIPLRDELTDDDGYSVYGLDLTKQIKKNPGSIYHVSLDFLPKHTNLNCKSQLDKYTVNYGSPSKKYFYSKNADYNEEYIYYPDYSWDKNTDPCHISFYAYKQPVQRMLICSDYAVIAKKAGSQYYVAVNNLTDLKAVSGAGISLYDLQAEQIGQSSTSGDGLAKISSELNNGAVLKITKGGQTTYMSLDEADCNPLTEYNISGELTESETEVFVYTDRNVWRPGDSIYVNVMFHKKNAEIPKGLPLTCSFLNTESTQIQEQIQAVDVDKKQIYTFVLHTPPAAKTGRYRCILKWGTKSHRQNIQVETIKPNTLETILDIDNEENKVVYSPTLSGNITSQYLTGFAAPNTRLKAVCKFFAIPNPFPDFGQYTFNTPGIKTEGNIELFDLKTDSDGKASFNSDFDFTVANTPGNIQIEIEGIPEGGGSNKEGKALRISPFVSYIGAERKVGTGWAGNHTFAENIDINLIRLDAKGKLLTAGHSVTYTVYKHSEHWWIDKYRLQNWGNFQQNDLWGFVKTNKVSINGKGLIRLPKGSLEKGAYKVVFTDENSGHETAVFFSVYDGEETIPGKEAHLLEIFTEKDEYTAGEKISLRLPDIAGAKAFVSVEQGKEIIQQSWHDLKDKNNTIDIPSQESWSPNIYLHVTIVQPYLKSGNDLPLRMYGVKSIRIAGKNKPLTPIADIPAVLESEKTYTFTVSEEKGRAMEYTLALVDEGLLNLKGFKTPAPQDHFNGKYPLLVKTWDIYKYLMSVFKGQFAGIISIGGDDAYKADALQEINRFKPVIIHQGSFKTSKNGKNKHVVTIPRYIGKLRLMIVACNAETQGSSEKMLTVKSPLMLQTRFPRNLQVSDQVRLPIQLFRDEAAIKTVNLTSTMSSPLLKGLPFNKNVSFGKGNTSTVYADAEVLNKPGKTTIEMTVKGNGKAMTEKTEMVVQYPNSYSSNIEKVVIQPGKSAFFEIQPKGYEEVFSGKLLISGTKAPDFVTFAEKLIEYPYGCLEQITSNGFGQLYLDKLLDLDPAANKKRLDHLRIISHKISTHQRGGGSFYYWDNDYYHAWSDMYAGHFLLEMKKMGYMPADNGVFQDWLNYAYQRANQWSVSGVNDKYYYESEALSHAYRMYILAKANKPARSAMNRFMTTCTSKNPLVWWLLAGSFAHAGFDSKATEMIVKAEKLTGENTRDMYTYSFGSKARDMALIVEVLSGIDGQKNKAERYFNAMVEAFNNSGWNSTQDMGFACLATYAYYGGNLSLNKDVEYTISGMKAVESMKHKANSGKSISVGKAYWNKKIEVRNTGKSAIFISKYLRYIGEEINLPAEQNEVKMNVQYYNITQKQPGLENVRLGDDIRISVAISNPSATAIRDMALSVVMPSGFELINPRLYQTNVVSKNSSFQFQDFKDDRVYTFFMLESNGTKNFEFKAKAAFTGNFYVPRTSCENMYKGNMYAKTASGRVIITE